MLQEINFRTLGKRKILVAEDVAVNQQLVRRIMESWGVEVDIANNGREALLMLEAQDYDMVLMDIQMPEMDGVEATQRIRSLTDGRKSTIPIVALTANFLKGDRERYKAAGMNDFLPKPFNESALFVVVSNNLHPAGNYGTTTVAPPRQEAAPARTPDKLYDLTTVRSMSGGDENFVRSLVQLFVNTTPETLKEMNKEVAQHNWEAVGRLAHKIKSAVDAMGIQSVHELLRTISVNGRSGADTDQLPGLVKQVVERLEPCLAAIRKDFPA
ncbi:MAG: response regulator [Candidatus Pseudobacter hemicellulosilyticus]|uniref:Response regulator n=1 Tax=Candidatus Pseudobacter hemicellulosilyticus TaxID=3121375 RepID=A0AAJ5WV69_9BACT|nr:MAG: response regulator [Pseudobacter sp.]